MTEQHDHFVSGKGESIMSTPKPNVVYFQVTGHLDKTIGRRFLDLVDRVVAVQSHFHAFCDFADTTGYDSEVRTMFTQWVASHRIRTTVHILVGSKIVSMGVSVANLALGGSLIGYTSRAIFDAAFRSAKMGLAGMRNR